MSEPVSYDDFCKRYDLNFGGEGSKKLYIDYSKNLDMFSEVVEKKSWGGSRAGSGRKTKYEKTKVLRVPEKYEEVIRELIKHLDDTAMIDFNWYGSTESKPVYIRSLEDKKQEITFKTVPK